MSDEREQKPKVQTKPVKPVNVPEQKPTLRWLRPEDIRRALVEKK